MCSNVDASSVTIREAVTAEDTSAFLDQLFLYFRRDLFPDPDDKRLKHALGATYYAQLCGMHARKQDPCRFLFFNRDGQDIGFALVLIENARDHRCFILEFCVYPPYRGQGTGTTCAQALLAWAFAQGARYAELNYTASPRRARFWKRLDFVENGVDAQGDPLLLLPPTDSVPIHIEVLEVPGDQQLLKLENSFLAEIGEAPLTDEKQECLSYAIQDGKIVFLIARRGTRAVGMCSIARCFSTFACSDTAVFEDFYIEPAFRRQGIARQLAKHAQAWCREQDISSLTVCCAPCDQAMYRALGFNAPLGQTLAHLP